MANSITDIISYPFRATNRPTLYLIAGCIFASQIVLLAPVIGGIASLIIQLFLLAMLMKIILSSANGESEAPDFPEIGNQSELSIPILYCVAAAIISFGPSFAYTAYFANDSPDQLISLGLYIFGAIYLPMALLGAAVLQSLSSLSPHRVIPSIVKAGASFWINLSLLYLITIATGALFELIDQLSMISWVITPFISSALILITGRAIGLIYHEREDALEWV